MSNKDENDCERERSTEQEHANLPPERRNLFKTLNDINIEDLENSEKDLSFYELVSLGFLLFGADLTNSEYILQKLLILLKQNTDVDETIEVTLDEQKSIDTNSIQQLLLGNVVLCPYARLNSANWRATIIESLAIVRSKRVLRKLGFYWNDLRTYYLPHITQLTVNVHPILKVLYMLCEQLTSKQTESLINYIHQEYFNNRLKREVQLEFDDRHYLELYLLYWISQRLITIGDRHCQGTNLQPLIDYFQTFQLDKFKSLLLDTTKYNMSGNFAKQMNLTESSTPLGKIRIVEGLSKDQTKNNNDTLNSPNFENNDDDDDRISNSSSSIPDRVYKLIRLFKRISSDNSSALTHNINIDRYSVKYSSAGYFLLINQSEFYQETDVTLKHLLPPHPFPRFREGTNVDRDRLSRLFFRHGYEAIIVENISHINMIREIHKIVKISRNRDSLIVAILTHGAKDVVYGNNSIPVYLNDIQEIMSASCLKGKPKMLIIQACQKVHLPTTGGMANQVARELPNIVDDSYADMLVALSALPGSESLRNTLKGSWYIESLCDVLEKFANRKHMVDILTIVTNAVTNKNCVEFMLPLFRSTLRKDFYLPTIPATSEHYDEGDKASNEDKY